MTEQLDAEVDRLEAEAWSFLRAQNLSDAQRSTETAIAMVENSRGVESPRLVPLLRLLAKLHARPFANDCELATTLLSRALAIAKSSDPAETTLAELYGQLGGALRGAGRLPEARAARERALEIATAAGAELSFPLRCLAAVITDISPMEAIPIWERLLGLEEAEGAESAPYMSALGEFGRCLLAAGKSEEAVVQFEHALRILESKTKGAPHRWADDLRELISKARSAHESKQP